MFTLNDGTLDSWLHTYMCARLVVSPILLKEFFYQRARSVLPYKTTDPGLVTRHHFHSPTGPTAAPQLCGNLGPPVRPTGTSTCIGNPLPQQTSAECVRSHQKHPLVPRCLPTCSQFTVTCPEFQPPVSISWWGLTALPSTIVQETTATARARRVRLRLSFPLDDRLQIQYNLWVV